MTQLSKQKAIERLQEAKFEIPKLREMPRFSLAFKKWRRSSVVAIEKVFGKEEYYADEFRRINFSPSVTFSGMPDSIWALC